MKAIERIRGGLIVSCQAWPDSPLHGSVYMAAMAQAAAKGGAAGIRANGTEDIRAIRGRLSLPIIGIQKSYDDRWRLWITATFGEARSLVEAGADIVAVDSRRTERPDGTRLGDLYERIHDDLQTPVMADVADWEQAAQAQRLGADMVSTTFAIEGRETPDFDLLARLVENLPLPVAAEGLYWTPEQVCRAFELGAHAVVVGTAITRPDEITARFVGVLQTFFGRRSNVGLHSGH